MRSKWEEYEKSLAKTNVIAVIYIPQQQLKSISENQNQQLGAIDVSDS